MSQSNPERGDVWEIDFGTPVGHEQGFMRPALIVSSQEYNESGFGLYVVLPMTTVEKVDFPCHVFMPREEADMRQDGYLKCEDVRSVSRERFIPYHGRVTDEKLEEALDMLHSFVFDL